MATANSQAKIPGRRKRKVRSTCYFCGGTPADSRDHVVPAGFFSPPLPQNMVTLPAHATCQGQYSGSEDYVRNILAGMAASGTAPNQAPGAAVTRAFQRNARLRTHIASGLIAAQDLYSNGGIYLGTSPALRFDPARFFPAPRKLVRALAFHHFGVILQPPDSDFSLEDL